MRQYIYEPHQVGLKEWPAGVLRLDFEQTTNPKDADVFVYPGALHEVTPQQWARLPYMQGNESRHVGFHCSDNEQLYGLPSLFIRCNTREWYFPSDPNTISFPWPVEQFAECIEPPANGFKYDVSFHGWLSSAARVQSSEACKHSGRIKCDIAQYNDFTGYIYYEPEGIRRRGEFRRSMKESRLALCPESIPGVFPYRFFEAMSAGRIPILVGSGYVYPFAEEIPYNDFVIRVPTDQARKTADYAAEYLASHTDDEIIERGRMARKYWERFLNRDEWVRLMSYAVEKKLSAVCA